MASNVHVATTYRNLIVDAIAAAAGVNSGLIRIYDGSQPANANTAISSQVLLAELTLNADAFPAASSGSAAANAITQDSSANASGTASWFRLVESGGTNVVLDGSVGTSGADLNLVTTSIVAGQPVTVTSFTISLAA